VVLGGLTLVVSPLIAPQRDQVDALRRHGDRTRAYAVSSADPRALAEETGLGVRAVGRILNLLDDAAGAGDVTARALEIAHAQRVMEQSRIEMMRGFCETQRRATTASGTASSRGYEGDPDRVTVPFEEAGYRTLALDAVREHGLLEPGQYLRWRWQWSHQGVVVVPLHGDAVAVWAMYRYPVGAVSLEFPRGGAQPGEAVEAAALRELKEETGLVADDARTIGRQRQHPCRPRAHPG